MKEKVTPTPDELINDVGLDDTGGNKFDGNITVETVLNDTLNLKDTTELPTSTETLNANDINININNNAVDRDDSVPEAIVDMQDEEDGEYIYGRWEYFDSNNDTVNEGNKFVDLSSLQNVVSVSPRQQLSYIADKRGNKETTTYLNKHVFLMQLVAFLKTETLRVKPNNILDFFTNQIFSEDNLVDLQTRIKPATYEL